ncbi:MAG: hypothetical protein JO132_11545 [Streptosporangiaceae bacterium]|nr:hypothetical protein [Streptosporangiaceae bacterium]
MCTGTVPATGDEALDRIESGLRYLAAADAAELPAETFGRWLRGLERAAAIEAAARGRLLEAFDAQDGHLADGQRTSRVWLVYSLGVTRPGAGRRA